MALTSRLALEVDGRGAEAQINNVRRALEALNQAGLRSGPVLSGAGQAANSAGQNSRSAAGQVQGLERQVRSLSSAAAGLAGPLAAAFSVKAFYDAAEAYSTLTNRMKLVTDGADELAAAQKAVFSIAQGAYSTNTALQMLWFLRNRCNVPDDEIVFETFASAANVCDETITNADGSVSQRYRTSCVIGADEQRPNVLQKLEAACAGKLIRVGGRWMLQAGAYYGPYDFEITEDMVVGTISGSTEPTNDSAINTVRGTFIDPEQSWTETDYPEVVVDEWVLEDGGEAAETLTFSYLTDPYQAQRLANIELRRRRAGGAISIPMNFAGYNCRPGRVVRVNLPSLNILGEFIVSDWSMGENEGCTVQVKQYEAAIYDDAVGQPYNPLGFISLPSGGLGSPTGLAWAAGDLAEVVQGVLSWVPPQGIVTSYVVTVRQGSNAVQSRAVPATSNTLAINGLPSGTYTMSVAALGPMARSGEATISVSIQGPPIPESCVVQSSIDSIVLIPQNPNHGLNGGTYEYFFSTNPNATSANADYLGQGLSFTHNDLGFYTNYYYFIRSSNAYGKSAFLYVPASTSNDVSAYLAALGGKITKTELGQDLLEEIELISGDGPGSVNERLEELQAEIGDLVDALKYDPERPYETGETVRLGQRLYTAKIPVPKGSANSPPNVTYWLDTGQVVQSANALAAQVTKNTADITTVDGKTSATATQLQAVQAQYREDSGEGDLLDALRGWDSAASAAQEVKIRAEEDFAQAQRTTTLQARVGTNEARITTIETTTATDREATAQRITAIDSRVGASESKITTIESTANTDRQATTQQIQTLTSSVGSNQAAIQSEATTRASADGALSTRVDGVQSTANGASAQAQTASTAVSGLNGKVSALTTIKTSTTVGGRTVMAGLAIGVEGQQQESQILAYAQRFAILDESSGSLTVPFAVQGGQVFINSALIQDGTITNAKIGNYIQSNNYVAGTSGWKLWFDGTFEINSAFAGGGRQVINAQGGKIYDPNNQKRYQWGNLDA
ncbi:hypothetical protein PS689_05432 [Pseudomonas fluorescens]|nr:hypothetical protein PS689_05432 [Pseudomonas fluorescens]